MELAFCFPASILRENGLAGPALRNSQQTLRLSICFWVVGGGGRVCDGAELTSSTGASYKRIRVGQGPTAHAIGAGESYLNIFLSSFIFPSL